jgi:hypothetical protein
VNVWLSPAHVAGLLALLIGLLDVWLFGSRFTMEFDKALLLTGLAWTAGVAVPSPLQLRGPVAP